MSDAAIRRAERRYQQEPTLENKAAWWAALLRGGQLPPSYKIMSGGDSQVWVIDEMAYHSIPMIYGRIYLYKGNYIDGPEITKKIRFINEKQEHRDLIAALWQLVEDYHGR